GRMVGVTWAHKQVHPYKIFPRTSTITAIHSTMSQFDSSKDYYDILGAEEGASPRDIERLYKRLAALRHPDRGGSEDEMKSLNEAYGVLKDEAVRRVYDSQRRKP